MPELSDPYMRSSYDASYTPPGSPDGGQPSDFSITNASMGLSDFGTPITTYAQGPMGTPPQEGGYYSVPPNQYPIDPFAGQQSGFGDPRFAGMGAEARRSGDMAMQEAARMRGAGGAAATMMDPFAPYRGAFAKQLMDLQRNPSSITSTPGYQAGLEGVQRAMAAQGYQGSGNMMNELAKYSGEFYNQTMDRLGRFAGAGATPGAGAGLYMQGMSQGADLTGQGLASWGYASGLGY